VRRVLPFALAAVLAAEVIAAAALHRPDAELTAVARSGSTRERAVALYRLARRDDGSAATPQLLEEAARADPRLAVLVTGVLDTGPGSRLRRRALVAEAPDAETARYLELMFRRTRTIEEYRELLARSAR
jgi:hypothetical protein